MEQRLSSRDLSVDVPIGDDDEATLLHFLPDHKQNPGRRISPRPSTSRCCGKRWSSSPGRLKDKELVIYRERLLNEDPLTLREIGDKYGISRERVRQIEERVKKKLKTYLSKEFKDATDITGAGLPTRLRRERRSSIISTAARTSSIRLRQFRHLIAKINRISEERNCSLKNKWKSSRRAQKVWKFIWDVDRFIACVPGCKDAKTIEDGQALLRDHGGEGRAFSRRVSDHH